MIDEPTPRSPSREAREAPREATPVLQGLHHVTATVTEAQADLDFHAGVLGLRLVKATVNFDNPGVYHFYYGDAEGSPSSIMTTFPYGGRGVRPGQVGAGQVTLTRYAVPSGSLSWWEGRLARAGVELGRTAGSLQFRDPSGLRYALVEADGDPRQPWAKGGEPTVPLERAIRGVHSVVLSVRRLDPSVAFATGILGLEEVDRRPGRVTLAAPVPKGTSGDGGPAVDPEGPPRPGTLLEIEEADPRLPDGVNGLGTVHHVALAVADAEAQLAFRARLVEAGVHVTEVRDREYFTSIYFREPGGILYEIATAGPGFAVDESPDALGRTLCLPSWEEANRAGIEAQLSPITNPADPEVSLP
jgi:glyoxalase family protein